mmetsp:Transcript_31613/g.76394  ORF Transcript_31613/g.76394 Transcript_31613/m.76394 type:complete len:439 (-) Transcript_31613:2626-3942(-)
MEDISIRLRAELDDDAEFRAITNGKADILIDDGSCRIGRIKAWVINRHKIPSGYFHTAFDSHSQTCQWLGCTMMEPRLGRIRLESLAPYDHEYSGFMIIHSFRIADDHKERGYSDVETVALRKFLHHHSIVKNVSTLVYVLDSDYDRQDANAFLRNGFFQDPAIALDGGDAQRILVASSQHTRMPMKSHRTAAKIKFVSISDAEQPNEIDEELLKYIKNCPRMMNCLDADDRVTTSKAQKIFKQVDRYLRKGASVSRSHALIAAVANDWFPLVKYLLELDPSAINAADKNRLTPLMMGGINAVGKGTDDETIVLDYLLSNGADISLQDKNGMTAYGHYVRECMEHAEMDCAIMGHRMHAKSPATFVSKTASGRVIQSKLLPSNGQSVSDRRGGERPGIIVYDDGASYDDASYDDSSEYSSDYSYPWDDSMPHDDTCAY